MSIANGLNHRDGGSHHGKSHPVSTGMHEGHDCRRGGRFGPVVYSSAIRKGTVDINLLRTIHIDNTCIAGVLRLSTVEKLLVVGTVIIVVASTLLVFFT